YGSYLKEDSDIVGSSLMTVMANASFDIIAGVTVFSTLGYLVTNMGVEFDSFGSGAGIAFIAFPIAISTITSNIFLQGMLGFLFFFCLFIAGLSSSISMLEAFTTASLDKFKIPRERIVTIISIIGFLGSVCFATFAGFNYILDIVDSHVGNYVIATLGLVETILVCYVYGVEKIRVDANEYSNIKVGKYFNFLLKYVTPIILGITVVSNLVKEFKKLAGLLVENKEAFMGEMVFGWGVILLMLLASIFLYLKKED
ncbi:MAG: sodium-dependent transporter, partial [Fusobacterium sp.]